MKLYYLFFCILIMHSLQATFQTITQPGSYTFGGQFTFTPTTSGDQVIHIMSSNVILELAQSLFTQDSTALLSAVDGILIDSGLENITIQNGVFNGFTGCAIRVKDNCESIIIRNIAIQDCIEAGISLEGSSKGINNVLITQCSVVSCTGSNGSPAFGIKSFNTNGTLFSNCATELCDALMTSSGFGIYCNNAVNCTINTCQSSGNGGFLEGRGIRFDNCSRCSIVNTEVSTNHSWAQTTTAAASGIYFNQTNNSSARLVKATGNTSAGIVAGILCANGSHNAIRDCTCNDNIGTTASAGILLNSETETVINSSFLKDNVSSNTAYGIYLQGNTNCNISANEINNNLGQVATFGINDTSNPSTNLVIKNIAFDNGTNYSVTYAAGVTLPVLIGKVSGSPGLPSGTGGILDNIDISP